MISDRRGDILDTVINMLLCGEIATISITRVAEVACVSRQTIHNHWRTARDMVSDAIAHGVANNNRDIIKIAQAIQHESVM